MKRQIIILVCLAAGGAALAGGDSAPPVRVHLPRAISVTGKTLTLGQLGVVRGTDAVLTKRVTALAMGRAPWSKEKMVITRDLILTQLAMADIDTKDVRVTGASEIIVTRDEKTLPASRLTQCAREMLEKAPPSPKGVRWKLVHEPKDMVVASNSKIELRARSGKTAPAGHLTVEVDVLDKGKKLQTIKLLYKLSYPVTQAIAAKNVTLGEELTDKNVKIRTVYLPHPARTPWRSPIGQVAARTFPAGAVITATMAKPKTRPILVKQNHRVQMRIIGDGFVITAMGRALQNGRAGDFIKVLNVDTQRILLAKVVFDGTVEPVYDKR